MDRYRKMRRAKRLLGPTGWLQYWEKLRDMDIAIQAHCLVGGSGKQLRKAKHEMRSLPPLSPRR